VIPVIRAFLVISVSQVFLVSLVDLILTRTSLREKTQVKAKAKVKIEVEENFGNFDANIWTVKSA
jgi:hypothetical protein